MLYHSDRPGYAIVTLVLNFQFHEATKVYFLHMHSPLRFQETLQGSNPPHVGSAFQSVLIVGFMIFTWGFLHDQHNRGRERDRLLIQCAFPCPLARAVTWPCPTVGAGWSVGKCKCPVCPGEEEDKMRALEIFTTDAQSQWEVFLGNCCEAMISSRAKGKTDRN